MSGEGHTEEQDLGGEQGSPVLPQPQAGNQGVPNYGIAEDFPLLWQRALDFDFAERLGGCSDPLLAEIDAALTELHAARGALAGDGA